MYDKVKHHIYTNFLALVGYTLIWYIYESVTIIYATKSLYGFWFVTSFLFCPYMFLNFLLALIIFSIEFICKKLKKTEPKEKQNNIYYNIFFNTGFSLFIFFSIFFILYVIFCTITNVLNID